MLAATKQQRPNPSHFWSGPATTSHDLSPVHLTYPGQQTKGNDDASQDNEHVISAIHVPETGRDQTKMLTS